MDLGSIYSPLDPLRREIRLVTILPCEDDEGQIVCQLETASLDNDPKYAAMSYVWGDAAVTTDILVDNIPFAATTNLVAGLLQFRRAGLGQPGKGKDAGLSRLWIDSICINQQDMAERNQQVSFMGDIYMNARYVLSWLGLPGDSNIDNSLRLMRSFSQTLPIWVKQKVLDMEINMLGWKNHSVEKSGAATGYSKIHTRTQRQRSLRLIRKFSRVLPSWLKQKVVDKEINMSGWKEHSAEESDAATGDSKINTRTKRQREAGYGDNTIDRLVQAGLKWISEHPELHVPDTDAPNDAAWRSFEALMHLSYWNRVWIQQEQVLCRDVEANLIYCGTETVTFGDMILFFKLVFAIDSRGITPPEINDLQWSVTLTTLRTPIIEPVVYMRKTWKRGMSLPQVVPLLAKKCNATDPRDMVYGLRSVLNLDVDVDYGKTVREIYLEWHAEALRDFRARGDIERCGIGMAGRAISKENPHNLPSWLPDLAILNKPRYVYQLPDDEKLGTGGRFQLEVVEGQQYSDDSVLSIYGVAYDRVCRMSQVIGDAKTEPNDPFEFSRVKELAVDYILEMKTRDHPTGLRPLQVLFYTIHQGTDPYTREKFVPRLDPTSISAQTFRIFILTGNTIDPRQDLSHVDLEAVGGIDEYLDLRFCDTADADANADERLRWMHATDGISDDDLEKGLERYITDVQRFLGGRVIFYTTDGYIGIGPEGMQIGDQLCVINNCHLPVLLREEGPGHVLVCSVYVYGLSENEPLDMLESGKVKLRKFEIH